MTASTIATQIAQLQTQLKAEKKLEHTAAVAARAATRKEDFARARAAVEAARQQAAWLRDSARVARKNKAAERASAIAECKAILKGLGLKNEEFEAALA